MRKVTWRWRGPVAHQGCCQGICAFTFSSAELNNRLYAIGGQDGGQWTNVYRYDGTNWTEVAGLPAARNYLAAGVLNGALSTTSVVTEITVF